MSGRLLRSAFARLRPVARRDERIAELTRRLAKLQGSRQAMAKKPSFQARLNEEKRLRKLEVELGAPSRSVIAGGKFHVYDLVRSHGIDIPDQYGRWDDPADIPWNDLPDAVVIQSAFGAASHRVFLVTRVDGGWRVATQDATVTSEQLTADLVDQVELGTIRPPIGAEEFLDDGSGDPPVDVEAYAFYGEVPLVILRRSSEHGNPHASLFRVVDAQGADLLDRYDGKPTDPSIPLPGALAELFEVASRVSTAIRAPYSRIDLYELHGRIVFGGVTPRPGTTGWFSPELDMAMGEAWERAQVRLWRDIADGMSPEPEWGPHADGDALPPQRHQVSGDALTRPSHRSRIYAERRLHDLAAELGVPSTSIIRHGKFYVYDLARSHGFDVPEQYGRWDDPADIGWGDLPDLVVIKSAFGSTSRGVFPLRRVDTGWQVITRDTIMTEDQMTAALKDLVEMGHAKPPFAAEEFLDPDGTGLHKPIDIRALSFYGEVPFVALRHNAEHGNDRTTTYRYVDRNGADVLDTHPSVTVDQTIPVPPALGDLFEAASRLSIAIRAPFARIDLYAMGDRVVFGEVTPRPGGRQWFGPEVDLALGEAWERAQVRLWRDIADGMSPEPEWGPHTGGTM